MKPTFALDLSRDTIALLHRTPRGWLQLGEVAFDAPDLDQAVAALRKTALELSPLDMACKIVLPASQILYTEIHAPGPSREDKRRQIAEALEGRTPYPVEDLVFDWSGKGQTVKVAVVARETLDEAEAFAVGHQLNPVSFVAIPAEGTFVGEAWFGPTAAAEPLIAAGTSIDRDRDAVVLLLPEPPAAPDAAMAEPAPAPSAAAEAAPVTADEAPPPADEPLPGLEEALNAELPAAAAPVTAAPSEALPFTPELEDQGDSLPGGQDLSTLAATATAPEPTVIVEPEPAVDAEPAATRLAEPEAPAPARAPLPPEPEADEAPFAHVADPAAPAEDDTPPAPPRPVLVDDLAADDIPPAPPSAAMVAFSSRRAAAAGGIPRPSLDTASQLTAAAPSAETSARLGSAIPPRPAPAKGLPGMVTSPTIPGTRAKPKPKPGLPPQPAVAASAAAGGPTTVRSPARPGGTFGTAAPQRGRSGVVLMVLVALMLISLALVAAWSSYFLSQNDSETTTSALTEQPLPDVEDEMLADMQDPEGMTDPLPEAEGAPIEGGAAAIATESLAETEVAINLAEEEATDLPAGTLAEAAQPEAAVAGEQDQTAAEEAPAEDLPLDPAPATRVATEVSAAQAPVEDQDEIFLAAMDAPPPALDALALPPPAATVDTLPDAPMPPPAFGTVYQFDANGLLMPTPEGIMSPDGVMLIAGPPPVLPPSRSETAAALAAAAAAAAPPSQPEAPVASPADASLVTAGTATPDPAADAVAEPPPAADPAMAGFRPRPRPEGLVPATDDDASVQQETQSDFAGLRPLPRPDSVLVAASASRPSAEPVAADLGAQGASLAAQAEAQAAAAAALLAENPSVIVYSMRPMARPDDLSRAVEAAVAAAVREPAPEPEPEQVAAAAPAPDLKPEELEELEEPEAVAAAPQIPTRANVAKQATFANAINLSKINLIGTYGTDSRRYALIRQANGRYKKVEVGDRIDGGTVKAITETEVRYQKGGRLLTLKMPKA